MGHSPGGVPLRTVSRARREASVYPPFCFGPHLHSGSKHLVLHVPVAHMCNYNLRWRWWWGRPGPLGLESKEHESPAARCVTLGKSPASGNQVCHL